MNKNGIRCVALFLLYVFPLLIFSAYSLKHEGGTYIYYGWIYREQDQEWQPNYSDIHVTANKTLWLSIPLERRELNILSTHPTLAMGLLFELGWILAVTVFGAEKIMEIEPQK